ncbi:MAG TPA: hypothetical protein VGZ71_13995, partial [Puia sp.]|nr:hypothetical protein [Puia sp.]
MEKIMCIYRNLAVILLVTAMLAGCGKKPSKTSVVNQATINSLSALMVANPEFATATLKDIKDAAGIPNVINDPLKMDPMLATAPTENAAIPTLKPEVAKEAQALIDKILNEFDMEAQLDAEFRVLGIVINMQRNLMKEMENRKDSGPIPTNAKLLEYDSSYGNAKFENMPTCEQIIDKPFGEMPKDQIDEIIRKNSQDLKEHLSGCAKIEGKPFTDCIDGFNKMAAVVNEHATCSMQNLDELTEMAEQEFGKSFNAIQNTAIDCFNNQF